MSDSCSVPIAYFITPHGFGHASRAAAVMAALNALLPSVRFELFTTSPPWIFEDTLLAPFGYHPVDADIGMVQHTPLQTDVEATCSALDRRLPFDPALLDRLAGQLRATRCRLVICDIDALGIAVAQKAGLPSVLVENFTWDWIYRGYLDQAPRLKRHIIYLAGLYERADLHLQTEPLCLRRPGAPLLNPISRRPRHEAEAVRRRLGVSPRSRMVLVSMGGIPDQFAFLRHLPPTPGVVLVIPGASEAGGQGRDNLIALPAHSKFYHPDLIQAADALVGKAGYSTVAEAYRTGLPFGYISRTDSPESPALEAFITANLPSLAIDAQTYTSGRWVEALPDLLAMPRNAHPQTDGAESAAARVLTLLKHSKT